MTNYLNLTKDQAAEIDALTFDQLNAIRVKIQCEDFSDKHTREAVAGYVADGGQISDLTGAPANQNGAN